MNYSSELTIPPNTSQLNPVTASVEMLPGTVTRVRLDFPPGCFGLARVEIWHKSFKLWPSSPMSYFAGDTFPIEWPEDYQLVEAPFTLTIKGWNLDNVYPHTVTVRFAVLTGLSGWQRYFAQMFGA